MFVVNGLLLNGDGHMFGGSGWWMVLPITFIVLVILLLFGFLRRGSAMWMGPMGADDHSEGDGEGTRSAVELSRRRYAAGELTDEQSDAMRRKLEDNA